MNLKEEAFRLVVLRWRDPLGGEVTVGRLIQSVRILLSCNSKRKLYGDIMKGGQMENIIKELKIDWDGADAFWFSLGVLAYNT